MNRSRTSLIVLLFAAAVAGCTGQVVDRTSHVQEPVRHVEVVSQRQNDIDWRAFESELTQQYLAEIAAELESIRLPVSQQVTVTKSLASLPTPSELATFTPPGPLDGEAYESLASAAEAHETCLAVHADNLANVDSIAFKRRVPVLTDSESPGCKIAEVRRDFKQGPFLDTGNSLDVAIVGAGFFRVSDQVTGLTRYTRSGNLSVNADGAITFGSATSSRLLEPNITIPDGAKDLNISANGNVDYRLVGDTAMQNAGQIQLINFVALDGLESLGEGLYAETEASGTPMVGIPGNDGLGILKSGMLEGSNVKSYSELAASLQHMRMLKVVRWLLLAESTKPIPQRATQATPLATTQDTTQDNTEDTSQDTPQDNKEATSEDSQQSDEED